MNQKLKSLFCCAPSREISKGDRRWRLRSRGGHLRGTVLSGLSLCPHTLTCVSWKLGSTVPSLPEELCATHLAMQRGGSRHPSINCRKEKMESLPVEHETATSGYLAPNQSPAFSSAHGALDTEAKRSVSWCCMLEC